MAVNRFSLSVKAVVFDSQKRCLLIRRSGLNHSFVGKWEWPGGKVDAGEDFATAVVREMREETSLEVEIVQLAGATSFEMPSVSVVLLCMEARILGDSEIRLSSEHDAFAWVPLEELERTELPEPIRDFMLDYARGQLPSR